MKKGPVGPPSSCGDAAEKPRYFFVVFLVPAAFLSPPSFFAAPFSWWLIGPSFALTRSRRADPPSLRPAAAGDAGGERRGGARQG